MKRIYRAKTLRGDERRVRQLQRVVGAYSAIATRLKLERKLMAMLAADGAAFCNPLTIYDAKKIRDEILAKECRMKPDGSPL